MPSSPTSWSFCASCPTIPHRCRSDAPRPATIRMNVVHKPQWQSRTEWTRINLALSPRAGIFIGLFSATTSLEHMHLMARNCRFLVVLACLLILGGPAALASDNLTQHHA